MSLRLKNRPRSSGPLGSNASLRPSSERRFKARARKRRLLSLRPVLIGVVLVGLLVGAGWVVVASSLLAVHHVRVVGTSRLDPVQVEEAAKVPDNHPLARLDTAAIRRRVEALPPVKSARVERTWPSTVTITVVERTAAAVVKRPGKPLALMDRTGVVFADVTAPPTGMSVLSLANPGPTDLATSAALDVVESIPPAVRADVASVTAPTPASVTLTLTSGLTVIWGDGSNSARKAQELGAVLHSMASAKSTPPPATGTKKGKDAAVPVPTIPATAKTVDLSSPNVITVK
jgi:cell division protein FtsQ